MKLLVTGAAGFIGNHFCKAAYLAGHIVFGIDDNSLGTRPVEKWGYSIQASISEKDVISKICLENNIEAVVHFAGRSAIRESINNPELYSRTNYEGTSALLEGIRNTGVDYFIFSSSSTVYGESDQLYISESAPLNPINPYGQTKLACETLLLQQELKVAILRYFSVVGEDPDCSARLQQQPEPHIVPRISQALTQNRPFEIFGTDYPTEDGTCIRDFVDVRDLALVHLSALEFLKKNDGPLISNVGTGVPTSVQDVLNIYKKVFGKLPVLEARERIEGNPSRLVASDKFLRSWYDGPFRSLEESLNGANVDLAD